MPDLFVASDGDDSCAATTLHRVFIDQSALAITVLGYGEKSIALLHNFGTDQTIVSLEPDALYASTCTADGADVGFFKPYRHACLRGQ